MAVWDVAARPDGEQLGYWHGVICQALVPLTPRRSESARAEPGSGFAARVETRPSHDTVRARIRSQPQETTHPPPAGGGPHRRRVLRRRPPARRRPPGPVGRSESVVGPGQFTVVDTTEPYRFDFDEPWQMVSFRLPCDLLDARLGGARSPLGEPFGGAHGGGGDHDRASGPGGPAPRSTPGTITDLATPLGFGDAASCSRAFRREFGCTPSYVRAAPTAQPIRDPLLRAGPARPVFEKAVQAGFLKGFLSVPFGGAASSGVDAAILIEEWAAHRPDFVIAMTRSSRCSRRPLGAGCGHGLPGARRQRELSTPRPRPRAPAPPPSTTATTG